MKDFEESAAEVKDFVGVNSTGIVASAMVKHWTIDGAVSRLEGGIKEAEEEIRKKQLKVAEMEKKLAEFKNLKGQIVKIETQAEAIGQLAATGNTDIVTKMALKITETSKDFEASKAALDKSLEEYWQDVVEDYKNDANYQVSNL